MYRLLALTVLTFAALPLAAQDEVLQPVDPQAVAPDMLAQAQAAAGRGDHAEALSRYLRVLAASPDNVAALSGAGRAALAVGDTNAAVGFYARAEDLNPRDGAIKAGLASAMAQLGRAREALRFFSDAVSAGVQPAAIAADRGLAYDLTGQPKRAQADYALALRTAPSDEVTRRLALSQAIGGDRPAALATLDPLLRRQDVPAWRTRAFVYAITGDVGLAEQDARSVMPADQAAALAPYLTRLAALKPAEKAAAVYLGRFPSATQVAGTVSPRPAVAVTAPPRQVLAAAPATARPTLSFDRSIMAGASPNGTPLGAATPVPQLTTPPPQLALATPVQQVPPPAPAPTYAPPSPAPSRAERQAEQRANRAAAKAKADALAKAKEERAAAAEAKQNPERQWVQIAGGANKKDLPKAWAKLKAQYPAQLGGRTPWTMPFRFTNRLLIGPFPSEDAAQDWVTERRKEGFATFRVETPAGTTVARLAAK